MIVMDMVDVCRIDRRVISVWGRELSVFFGKTFSGEREGRL